MKKDLQLPHDLDAESAILAAVLIDGDSLFRIVDVVTAGDFYKEENRILFKTFISLVESDSPVDLVTVRAKLFEDDLLERVGGITFLSGLTDVLADVANVRHYAKVVKDHAVRRGLYDYAKALATKALSSGPVGEVLDEAGEGLIRVIGDKQGDGPAPIVEAGTRVVDQYEAMVRGDLSQVGVRTGFGNLDNGVLIRNGRVVVLAGATSSGKSSLAFQMAAQVAEAQKTVAFFSLEMSDEEIGTRYLSAKTGRDTRMIERGPATEAILKQLRQSLEGMEGTRLFLDDSVGLSPFDIRSKSRQIQMRHGLDLIVVDYLQLMTYKGGGRVSREQEVSAMSRGIKLVAKSLGVPVVLLSQLSRKHLDEKREPELRDLRESGAIENDADIVLMIHRLSNSQPGAKLLVRKQRQGPLGSIDMTFNGPTQQFSETGYNPAQLESGGLSRQADPSRGSIIKDGEAFDEGDSDGIDF
jgi:replicative DNA helicase